MSKVTLQSVRLLSTASYSKNVGMYYLLPPIILLGGAATSSAPCSRAYGKRESWELKIEVRKLQRKPDRKRKHSTATGWLRHHSGSRPSAMDTLDSRKNVWYRHFQPLKSEHNSSYRVTCNNIMQCLVKDRCENVLAMFRQKLLWSMTLLRTA